MTAIGPGTMTFIAPLTALTVAVNSSELNQTPFSRKSCLTACLSVSAV